MIGIVIATHGAFGQEIVKSAELIVGQQPKVLSFGLYHNDNIGEFQSRIMQAVRELDDGDGILILTDLYGGSPCNSVALCLREVAIESLTGVNLPMLLEALLSRSGLSLTELTKKCEESAHSGIKNLGLILRAECGPSSREEPMTEMKRGGERV